MVQPIKCKQTQRNIRVLRHTLYVCDDVGVTFMTYTRCGYFSCITLLLGHGEHGQNLTHFGEISSMSKEKNYEGNEEISQHSTTWDFCGKSLTCTFRCRRKLFPGFSPPLLNLTTRLFTENNAINFVAWRNKFLSS